MASFSIVMDKSAFELFLYTFKDADIYEVKLFTATNNAVLTAIENIVTLCFLLFLLKFLSASVPSNPNTFAITGFTFTFFRLSPVLSFCLSACKTVILTAFNAGISADINTVITVTAIAIITLTADICILSVFTDSLEVIITANCFPRRFNVIPIPAIPHIIPIGIPIIHKSPASKNTLLKICFLVAPADFKRPNCFVLSLTDIENALWISDTEAIIIINISIAPIPYKVLL